MNVSYREVWERLQTRSVVVLQLPETSLTEEEVREQLQQIKRGVIKAKTMDAGFRVVNGDNMPKLFIVMNVPARKIRFELKLRFGLIDIEPTAEP